MNPPPPDAGPLRLDRLLGVLPRTDAVRPLVARLMATSRADETRRWTVSGELGTAEGRIVEPRAFRAEADAWIAEETRRLERRAAAVAGVAEALAAADLARVVEVLLSESSALEAEGMSAEAEAWADAAFRVANEAGDGRAAEARRRAARCARGRGDLSAATAAYEDAWRRARNAGRPVDEVVAATGRGNVAVDRGRWAEAEAWYRRAMAALDGPRTPLEERTARALRWRIFQNLGITHRERGELDASERWYRRADEESRGLADPAAEVEIENGWGQLALARGDPAAAEARFRRALGSMTGDRPDAVRVAVRANLAEALLLRGRTLEAGVAAREAEAEAIQGRHMGRLPEVYRVLARVAAERGETEAFVLVDRALALVKEAELPAIEEARTLQVWADLREAQDEHDLAREARMRASRILESLKGEDPRSGDDDDDGSRDGGIS